MRMVKKMDAGPIIGQVDVPLDINENGISLRSNWLQLAYHYLELIFHN